MEATITSRPPHVPPVKAPPLLAIHPLNAPPVKAAPPQLLVPNHTTTSPVYDIDGKQVTTIAFHFTHRVQDVEHELSTIMSKVKHKHVIVRIINLLDDGAQTIDKRALIYTICAEKGATYLSIVVMDDPRQESPTFKSPPPIPKNSNH